MQSATSGYLCAEMAAIMYNKSYSIIILTFSILIESFICVLFFLRSYILTPRLQLVTLHLPPMLQFFSFSNFEEYVNLIVDI